MSLSLSQRGARRLRSSQRGQHRCARGIHWSLVQCLAAARARRATTQVQRCGGGAKRPHLLRTAFGASDWRVRRAHTPCRADRHRRLEPTQVRWRRTRQRDRLLILCPALGERHWRARPAHHGLPHAASSARRRPRGNNWRRDPRAMERGRHGGCAPRVLCAVQCRQRLATGHSRRFNRCGQRDDALHAQRWKVLRWRVRRQPLLLGALQRAGDRRPRRHHAALHHDRDQRPRGPRAWQVRRGCHAGRARHLLPALPGPRGHPGHYHSGPHIRTHLAGRRLRPVQVLGGGCPSAVGLLCAA